MNLFRIFGTIAVNNSEANQAIDQTADKAKTASSTVGNKLTTMGNTMTSLGKRLAPVSAGVAALGGALLAVAKKTASTTDNIDKMSQKLGISRTAYQEWDYILSQNGSSIDSLKTGMKTLNNTLDQVNQKGSTTGTAFERLGISFDDLKGKSKEEIFNTTIRALQNCKDETERTKLATQLFGRAGVDLAPLLNSGAESTDKLRQKAHDLGLVLDDEVIDAGVDMTDAMDTMKRSISAVGSNLAVAVMPYITKFCDYVSEHMPQIQRTVRNVANAFNRLSPTVKKLIAITAGVLAGASPVLIIVGKMVSGVGGLIMKVSSISGLLGKLSGAFGALTSPVGLVVIAIAALVAIFAVLYTKNEAFRNKVNKIWNQIKQTISTVITAIKGLITAFVTAVKSIWSKWGTDITNICTTLFTGIMNIVDAQLKVIRGIIKTLTALINGDWKGVWNGIKETVSAVWNLIKTTINTALNVIKQILQTQLKFIKSVISTAWDAIKTVFTTVWNAIKTIVSTAITAVKDKVSSVLGTIKTTFSNAWDTIKTTVSNAITNVKEKVNNVLDSTKSAVADKINNIKSEFSSKFESVKSTVTEKMGSIKSAITSKISEAKSTALGYVDDIKTGIKNKFNSAKSAVESTLKTIKGFFPKGVGKLISFSKPTIVLQTASKTVLGKTITYPTGFDVKWNRKAMSNPVMFTRPTVFDINPLTGTAKGAGEAGDEMMYGHQNLMADIKQAVSEGTEDNATAAAINLIYSWLTRGGFRRMLIDILTNSVSFEFENREVARVVERYAR